MGLCTYDASGKETAVGGRTEWSLAQVKCWAWGQEITPDKEFLKEFTWVKMVFEVQTIHTPTCGYNHLCQRNSQTQLLQVVSLDLPFYTQRPKTKQAVAWQKPGAAWHHSRSMLLALAVANPRHREKEKEEEEEAAHRQCQASLLQQDLQVVGSLSKQVRMPAMIERDTHLI